MIVSDAVLAMNLGNYRRLEVSNVDVEVDSVDNDVDDDKSRMLLDESDTNNCNGNATPAETEKNSPTKSRMTGRMFFDVGMRLLMSYQHELAAHCFLACLQKCPDAALAHGLLALCHSPNYNFKGDAYYESACHYDEALQLNDLLCVFPSQQVADRHSAAAMETVEALKRRHKHQNNQNNNNHNHKKKNGGKKSKSHNNNNGTTANHHATANNSAAVGNPDEIPPTTTTTTMISDVERMLLAAIRILTGTPGVDPTLSNETVGRPYAQAMRKVYQKYPSDPEVAYFFAESLMVLNAWQLYEYPSGKPVSVDVVETRAVLECALQLHPHHAGLSHMYVHLSEMSAHPELALPLACQSLRHGFPHAGHLIHMPTHIDVLTGDYESCVRYNLLAIEADRYAMECSPATAGRESFYFGYIVVRTVQNEKNRTNNVKSTSRYFATKLTLTHTFLKIVHSFCRILCRVSTIITWLFTVQF